MSSLFNGAQSFYLDPSVIAGSQTVDLSAVGMFFMYRPAAINNKSGVNYPGVTMFLTDVVGGVPNLANTEIFTNVARCEWNAVKTSSDASAETVFSFPAPVTLKTGASYAFCWAYDAGEDFLPWTNIKGNNLVGTTSQSTGPSSSYGGNYFLFSSVIPASGSASSIQNYQTAWQPLSSTDAKFKIYAARYAVNGVPIVANVAGLDANTQLFTSNLNFIYVANTNSLQITKPSPRVENIAFDIESSSKYSYVGAQRAYQSTINWPGGGVYATVKSTSSNTLIANSNMSNGAVFSWNSLFNGYTGDKYVVVDYGTGVDVRRVTSIISNTVVSLDENTTSVNTAAKIIISPVAVTDSFNTSIINGKKSSLMFLRDSSANSSVRFVGHAVNHAITSIGVGGTGYSNSDVLYVAGYNNVNNAITSNYPAVANLQTNSTGGIVQLNWSNVGAGFSNSAQTQVVVLSSANAAVNTSTTNTSAGAGLVVNATFGSTIMTEQTNNVFRNCRPINIDVHTMLPVMDLTAAANTTSNVTLTTQYYLANNSLTPNGFITLVGPTQTFPLRLGQMAALNSLTNIPVIVSRSNEFGVHYANGALNDQVSGPTPYSNCFNLVFNVASNNDYVALGPFNSPLVDFGRYIVNNDYTNEHTDSGNAVARHVSTVFNMTGPANNNLMAEDLRFYVSAWRPPGTDIQVYARIQNSTDAEAFNDEDWTRMQLINGSNTFSTSGYTDLTFGFQGQPNTALTLAGTANTTNGSAVLTGSNTAWNTVTNNSLVKVYDPLFANNNYAVCLVTSVTNSSQMTVDQVFSTNTATGIGGFALSGRGGLKVDVLGFGHQVFNNPQNFNIARYYNINENVFDGFNTVQMKIIMLSSDPHFIPRIHNLRGLGVSA